MVVPLALGFVRPVSPPWVRLTRSVNPFIHSGKDSFPITRNGSLRWSRIFQASLHSSPVHDSNGAQVSVDQSEIIFIGTGTSEGIPRVSCLTNVNKSCTVCSKATEPGNKNRRLNTSLLVRFPSPSGKCNILIDAGKFFYHSALRWFPTYGIRTIDAVIITHSHADAIGGLDDLRDWTNNVQPSVPIYTAQRDFEVMKKTHYLLVDTSGIIPGAAVSALQFNIIKEEPFVVHDLQFTPLPVWHGQGYRSLGFRFGNICYISDVSEIPEDTYPLTVVCSTATVGGFDGNDYLKYAVGGHDGEKLVSNVEIYDAHVIIWMAG